MFKTRWFYIGLLSSLILTMGVAAISAQELANEDWRSDTTNLCNEGGLAGQCYFPENPNLTEWYYNMGWWWMRVEERDITPCQVPPEYGGYCGNGATGTVAITRNGVTLIIVLGGSPYGGPSDIAVDGPNFDFNTDLPPGINPEDVDGLIIYGNDEANIIIGSPGDDQIYGYGGTDIIYGDGVGSPGDGGTYSGNDTIDGGAGNDSIMGDSGNGDNNIGNDSLIGSDGDDTIRGDSDGGGNNGGNDNIDGGGGNDLIVGDSGDGGNNTGSDTIDGGEGNDTINGDSTGGGSNTGNDSINGGPGDDVLRGDSRDGGNNTGNNTIDGGGGVDSCTGGTTVNC